MAVGLVLPRRLRLASRVDAAGLAGRQGGVGRRVEALSVRRGRLRAGRWRDAFAVAVRALEAGRFDEAKARRDDRRMV
jgi:hypothetical protein